ncbi:RUN and FYVE domain-containing protein 2 isoform X2 [Halyomorpha halys]|uniref:RUN and FYVE domain-containing protein 2 isoform X2 n=1 Tax=Halyomorpha halys TaxID=286706 RepID=UPI0006D5011A|nr:RUN and FYVE domain-containing protein 2 isoform X2 [Halyomorpha halys]
MAAWSDNEVSSPNERRSFFRENDAKSSSRSPSIGSFEIWPSFLVSKTLPHKVSDKARDPVIIERRNLVNISKLIVKELIETSIKYGRMLDSDHMPLQHFFIVLEHVLRHGLRPKKGLLGPKKELWDLLQWVEKFTSEAQDITSSVRDLPTVRTQMGRARAWLRLALMQKKLADYLKILIDHRDDVLCDFFEPDALLMSDEAIIIVGLLVGLNVIDCNLCVKEEDLDCQQGVIDFSLYLRSSHHTSVGDSPEDDSDLDNMTTVLDQKNYIEELNRHLNATVANLQAKVESLTTTNALMKEDLAIAKKNIMAITEENAYLKADKKLDTISEKAEEDSAKEKDMAKEIERLKSELEVEKKKSTEVQHELDLQISLKAEMEVAMKLLEKDIHDKQDTIISLRRQLDDIKQINLEMYRKLQECESSLMHKTELISKLEAKTFAMTDTLQIMDDKAREVEKGKSAAEQALKAAAEVSESLRAERDMRRSLEEAIIEDKALIKDLQEELNELRIISKKYTTLQAEHKKISDKCSEQEETLEELGRHLSASKLEVSQLKEEVEGSNGVNPVVGSANWISDKEATHCYICHTVFTMTKRKHHCRNCGKIFCSSCCANYIPVSSSSKPVRICDECQIQLISKNFEDSTSYLTRT